MTERDAPPPLAAGAAGGAGTAAAGPPLVWTEPFTVRAYEVGPDETASALTVCDLLQEAAGEHARASDREGFALPGGGRSTWVLSRLRLRVDRRPRMRERVEVETWPASLDGLRATRDFRVTSGGETLATATSLWFLIDVARRRPVRLPPEMDGFEVPGKLRALTFDGAPEPAAPAETEHRSTFAVRRSDLDRVGHANNVRFVEWALEALPSDDGLRGVDVLYRSEAVYGDAVMSAAGPLAADGTRAHHLTPRRRPHARGRPHHLEPMTRALIALAVVLVAALAFRWWSSGGERQPAEAVARAVAGGAQVVDVRTSREYAGGHVAGAVHADVLAPGFEAAVAGLDRGEPVYLYCASGHRSGRAAAKMEALGFTRVVNAGGLGDLVAAGVPTDR